MIEPFRHLSHIAGAAFFMWLGAFIERNVRVRRSKPGDKDQRTWMRYIFGKHGIKEDF